MRVAGVKDVPLSLFEPDQQRACEVGVDMDDAVVEAKQGSCITLVVENPNLEPLCLKKSLTLGYLQPVESVLAAVRRESEQRAEESDQPDGELAHVSHIRPELSAKQKADRIEKLLSVLKLEEAGLTCEEHRKLAELIQENYDVFALDPSELGATDVVTHDIETGDHPPIHQHPR